MAMVVLIAKFFPITLSPNNRKGKFTRTIKEYKGSIVVSVIKSDIPVTPPSMNLFGSKKLSNPNAADKMPVEIKKVS
jgi:hypothetical protein